VEILRNGPHVHWSPDLLADALSQQYPHQQGVRRVLLAPEVVDHTSDDRLRDWHCDLFALTAFGPSLLAGEQLLKPEEQP
jgi:hypothetical protein